MSQAAYTKALTEWAKKWKEENLSEDVRKLISQANYDLWYGPINDGAVGDPAEGDEELSKYPGFTSACEKIREECDELPSDLYLDTDTGEVRQSEPEPERCETCAGTGEVEAEEGDGVEKCADCNGLCGFEPAGDWWHVERREIRHIILGKELAEHI